MKVIKTDLIPEIFCRQSQQIFERLGGAYDRKKGLQEDSRGFVLTSGKSKTERDAMGGADGVGLGVGVKVRVLISFNVGVNLETPGRHLNKDVE